MMCFCVLSIHIFIPRGYAGCPLAGAVASLCTPVASFRSVPYDAGCAVVVCCAVSFPVSYQWMWHVMKVNMYRVLPYLPV